MTSPPAFAAILAAAGRSSRMGSDKLWADLWGRPAWRWSLDVLLATPGLTRVAIAVGADAVERFRAALPAGAEERCLVVPGGDARADSVIAGLWALTAAGHADDALVLVHDAARPAVTVELVSAVAAAGAERDGAVIPVVPVVDSLKRIRSDRVAGPVEREEVAAAQTPQAARLGALRAAIEEAHAWGRPITDDAGALAAAGVPVHVVPGDPANRKLTEPSDLPAVRAVLADQATPAVASRTTALAAGSRAGVGFDAHRLVVGRRMRIAGVAFPDEPRGPEGHSDGDAALHALIDALLGAAALGDVGSMFDPGDERWAGADSGDLVRRAVARLAEHGWRPSGASVTVVVARPALAPRRAELALSIATLLGIEPDAVSVSGTTSDGLGFGGAEGMAAWAVAVVAPAT